MGKRLYILLLMAVFLICLGITPIQASPELTLEAEGAILVDPTTGRILFEQNGNQKWYPASMTKIMTMGLALEALEKGLVKLEDEVVTSEHAAGYGGTQVYLEPGERFTFEEMLIAISVGSANDASAAVAEFLAGSEDAFAKQMTEKARELGATATNFTNSHGLHDDDHYTTPRDMALISQWAMGFPRMKELTAIKEYTFRDEPKLLILYNTNKLLWWYPGTTGLKTGTTSAAKRNLAATADRNGFELLAVVMGVDRRNGHFGETMKLLNWGFASFKYEELFGQGEIVQEIKINKGTKDSLALIAEEKVGALLSKTDQQELETEIELPNYLVAPINRGEPVGYIKVKSNGQEVNKVALLAGEDVDRSSFWQLFGKTLNKALSL